MTGQQGMHYRRTAIGRGMQHLAARVFHGKYETIREQGVESLLIAKELYSKATILASHSSEQDIFALDHAIMEHSGEDRFPVFIMRDSLRIRLPGGIYLPLRLSQHLYTHDAGSAIPINQSDAHALGLAVPAIRRVFEDDRFLIIFPGGTRAFGPVNGLTEVASGLYPVFLKRERLDAGHCVIPCGIRYDDGGRSALVSYGRPLAVESLTSPRAFGKTVLEEIARLSGAGLENLVDEKTVREHIRKERLW